MVVIQLLHSVQGQQLQLASLQDTLLAQVATDDEEHKKQEDSYPEGQIVHFYGGRTCRLQTLKVSGETREH